MIHDNATAEEYLNFLNNIPCRNYTESIEVSQEKAKIIFVLQHLETCWDLS